MLDPTATEMYSAIHRIIQVESMTAFSLNTNTYHLNPRRSSHSDRVE